MAAFTVNGQLSCGSPRLVALGTFGALTKLKSAANDLPYTIARWRWAYLGSAMFKPAKSLIVRTSVDSNPGELGHAYWVPWWFCAAVAGRGRTRWVIS